MSCLREVIHLHARLLLSWRRSDSAWFHKLSLRELWGRQLLTQIGTGDEGTHWVLKNQLLGNDWLTAGGRRPVNFLAVGLRFIEMGFGVLLIDRVFLPQIIDPTHRRLVANALSLPGLLDLLACPRAIGLLLE